MHRRLVDIYLLNVPFFLQSLFQQNKTNVSFREIARLIARNSLGYRVHFLVKVILIDFQLEKYMQYKEKDVYIFLLQY